MGEPLLHQDIAKMVAYASSNKIKTVIFTNAVLLDRKRSLELLESGLDLLVISIDGIKKTFEDIRRGATFEQIISNIFTFRELCADYKTRLQLHYVVSSSNISEKIGRAHV